ncbi:hypothetical protein IOD13_17605 [Brevibacterium casei]|nr:hypothetical protein [Brevibacterium casei]
MLAAGVAAGAGVAGAGIAAASSGELRARTPRCRYAADCPGSQAATRGRRKVSLPPV